MNSKNHQPSPVPTLPTSAFASRRRQFLSRLLPNSVAFIVSNPEHTRSNDSEYPYRQSSDLLYLSNFPEPQSVLIFSNLALSPEGNADAMTATSASAATKSETIPKTTRKTQPKTKSVPASVQRFEMIVRPKDRTREIWTGKRYGTEGATIHFGADEAFTLTQFSEITKRLLSKADNVYYKFGRNEEFDRLFNTEWLNYSGTLLNPENITHEMRMVKSKEELQLMRHAANISAEAHCAAMRRCKPGLFEYQIQAELEKVFRERGASSPAYQSIVAGGANAVTLHYIENNQKLVAGDLLLIDAACEYQGYASDITRTFPVSGRFSPAQREIYDLVLTAQLVAIKHAKAGVTLAQVHEETSEILRNGLIDLGVLAKEMSSSVAEKEALEKFNKKTKKNPASNKATDQLPPLVLRDLFMHGTSHWLGLDVHDVGTTGTRSSHAKTVPMKPGMVFTVEPGLYFDPADKRLPKKYRGIGIRIEDDVVITRSGNEVLTSAVPKNIKEIEALMSTNPADP